ncbi:MAG: MinD/ParA family protein [Pseudomonadales bacterium]|nr:MinD/ParA family protein [Pseudomonadales bacterium]
MAHANTVAPVAATAKAPVRVIAVTGGKGGVGKTNVSINLGLALCQQQQRVLLLDADLGLANIDVLLGLRPEHNLEDVFAGECSLRDVMVDGPGGLQIIPASSGTQAMVRLDQQQHAGLIAAFSELVDDIDVLIIDTAAGIADAVVNFVRAAQEVLVVVCDEPSSITDAYALIKVLHRDYAVQSFRILANQTRSEREGRALYERLLATTDRFLDVMLHYAGDVPHDESVRKAVRKQQPVSLLYPKSPASRAFNRLAGEVQQWPLPDGPSGYLEFFVEKLLATS